MKKMFSILTGILLALPALCQQFTRPQEYDIKLVDHTAKPGTKLYLAYQTDGLKIIDSAVAADGVFRITGEIAKPLPATMVLDVNNEGLQNLVKKRSITENILQFYLHPGIINAITNGTLAKTEFFVSDINKDFTVFKTALSSISDKEITLSRAIMAERDTARLKPLEKSYDSLKMTRMPILKRFILSHPKSYISLVALQEYYGRLLGTDDYKITAAHLAESRDLFSGLVASVQNTADGRNFALKFANVTRLAPGAPAPDFTQPDKDGRPVKLSDFKGRYVLIDFWASWCGPCRQNNPELVKLYRQYTGRNFTILGVSLDDKEGRSAWLKAIKDDGLLWSQVSDLKHWDNAAAKLYTVAAIPQSILVGPDGTIVLNGASIEELKVKLNQLLPAK